MANLDLITTKEVMTELSIRSRQTLWNYEKRRNFPKPVKLRPKAYLRSDYEKWLQNGGASQQSS
ncbi:AlpA family phage regulatory protein [Providencia rettgeri]|uniref:helix-turn-helix transcriptional regulator n=1 Tax=Providencia rettgeri TaxID=587 RepID=UPI001CA7B2E2|nr:AlpA family phage regulatory protein [Providencia rettgeri]QZY66037.1 AlpA family phage regulatory protein [Providencia rettgeri]